ncbi:HD domain-containing phosphohydrolase [Herbaspirillum sp. alder98]|uniref:HD domain-containing phosphohydrolase n=1 Tax=Herbaspirillum sp. alder98 TaxID=2913096 RepID=UPI001CD8209A|nr:HD domain-containing phosphohydrolase [Herbaspirillum sp. alder98]MCA1324525.1 LuxR C-terminal-related transcriptional regulator [Herbaspirillum sp. alder98]
MPSDNFLSTTVPAHAAVRLLAMAGDLSMGQPTDQSARSACLAGRLALLDGAGDDAAMHARLVALLRWSGCTANAAGFAALLGDDVAGRDAMLRHALPPGHPLTFTNVEPLARIHCEVAGDVAGMLGLPAEVEAGLRHVWEHYDGGGAPQQLRTPAIPTVVYYTSLAGDLEILARTHDAQTAVRMIRDWGGAKYPAALAALAAEHAEPLLAALEGPDEDSPLPAHPVALSIVADLVELKLPWLAGYSRRVAELAGRAAALAGLPPEQQQRLARAALIHGVGRTSVANTIWERAGKPGRADWEKIRLAPYWTARAGALVPELREEAALASHMYERLDGSGYFRSIEREALGLPQRLLAAAGAYAALCAPRPWRTAQPPQQVAQLLEEEGRAGRFDEAAVGFVIAAAGGEGEGGIAPVRKGLLSEREAEVLRRISLGESNKEAARVMQISPSTVRTHVESIFRKLGCSTRAAATLKGLTLGLI